MTVSETTTLNGSVTNNNLNQPLNGPLTIDIVEQGTSTHLLTATVTGGPPIPMLSGVDHAAAVAASQPTNNVQFTSDVVSAADLGSGPAGLTLSLVAVDPRFRSPRRTS